MSSKTPGYTPKEIIKLLEEKGFVFDRASGSHQIFMLPDRSKRVIVPLHKKDLPKGTLLSILKQAGIDKKEL
jgi:predicted RNA binding protein YcfA (HicA-like mRNA interferase family)